MQGRIGEIYLVAVVDARCSACAAGSSPNTVAAPTAKALRRCQEGSVTATQQTGHAPNGDRVEFSAHPAIAIQIGGLESSGMVIGQGFSDIGDVTLQRCTARRGAPIAYDLLCDASQRPELSDALVEAIANEMAAETTSSNIRPIPIRDVGGGFENLAEILAQLSAS